LVAGRAESYKCVKVLEFGTRNGSEMQKQTCVPGELNVALTRGVPSRKIRRGTVQKNFEKRRVIPWPVPVRALLDSGKKDVIVNL